MKRIILASILTLSLLGFFAPTRPTTAQTGSSYARGTYRFILHDEIIKYVEFEAQTDEKGNASGRMTFIDEAKVSHRDDDGDPEGESDYSEFSMTAEFDTMTVEKNRAVMSGTVMESSYRAYVGKWVQLVVEDAGDNPRVSDNVSWGFCRPPAGSWIPTDAERAHDDGAFMRWWATDAERKDDVGIPSKNLIPGETKGCYVYPLSAYTFVDILKWEGDIVVGNRF